MACRCCERFHQAPLPSRPIERGRPGPGLLAHVLVSKYADHLPLYRQSNIYARDGIDLGRSTMAGWVGKSLALLEPLAEAIGKHVRAGDAIHADDTHVPVLDLSLFDSGLDRRLSILKETGLWDKYTEKNLSARRFDWHAAAA
jgi:hypothetical protein